MVVNRLMSYQFNDIGMMQYQITDEIHEIINILKDI